MNVYKYSIQYNKFKEGKTIIVKDSVASTDKKETVIKEFNERGFKNFKITRTKQRIKIKVLRLQQ